MPAALPVNTRNHRGASRFSKSNGFVTDTPFASVTTLGLSNKSTGIEPKPA